MVVKVETWVPERLIILCEDSFLLSLSCDKESNKENAPKINPTTRRISAPSQTADPRDFRTSLWMLLYNSFGYCIHFFTKVRVFSIT